jgi:hypothetical protein
MHYPLKKPAFWGHFLSSLSPSDRHKMPILAIFIGFIKNQNPAKFPKYTPWYGEWWSWLTMFKGWLLITIVDIE